MSNHQSSPPILVSSTNDTVGSLETFMEPTCPHWEVTLPVYSTHMERFEWEGSQSEKIFSVACKDEEHWHLSDSLSVASLNHQKFKRPGGSEFDLTLVMICFW